MYEAVFANITGKLKSGIKYDCIPVGAYDKLQAENERLKEEIAQLKNELEQNMIEAMAKPNYSQLKRKIAKLEQALIEHPY